LIAQIFLRHYRVFFPATCDERNNLSNHPKPAFHASGEATYYGPLWRRRGKQNRIQSEHLIHFLQRDDCMADSPPSRTNSEKFYEPNHHRERSLPNVDQFAGPSVVRKQQSFGDDVLIYSNLEEIERKKQAEFIDHQPYPPHPALNDEPCKVLVNGWREFKTIGGRSVLFLCKHYTPLLPSRSYYFNPTTATSQWQPPRSKKPCDVLQNSAYTSWSDKSKQHSKSSDQTSSISTASSTESLKYSVPPLITHATNPLIEKELNKAPTRIDVLGKSTVSFI
jgi:hypothetical protein